VKEDYGANATILTEYLRAVKIKPSPRLATALFYGIKTDTDNFARPSAPHDINAFRYLYQFANTGIIKKIESSEMTRSTLKSFRTALENLTFMKDKALIHLGKVNDPDVLVVTADFFLKLVEASGASCRGLRSKADRHFRNAGFRLDAGKMAQHVRTMGFWSWHKSMARRGSNLRNTTISHEDPEFKQFVMARIRGR
jgi:nanoRNase/pAp phosphatase (c-di-AMP/oligoRNAs hydrolase)